MGLEHPSIERHAKRTKMKKSTSSKVLTRVDSRRKLLSVKQSKQSQHKVKASNTAPKRGSARRRAVAVRKSWPVQNTCFLSSSEDESDAGGATSEIKLHRNRPTAAKGATESRSYQPPPGGYQLCALQRMFC